MNRFDARALWAALDEQRTARGLTWGQVAREIGVSASTIARLRQGARLEVDVMIAMVSWLKMPVERFVHDEPR